ncbi:MAG TPA: type II and III secretion system protein family protein [Candidatus Sulfotelmatobacter sp.]|nr:type II and III secretion system protein family protein [Candidatus Sulfotelmatobacter sp.]
MLRTTLDRSHTRLYSACFLALAATLLPRAGAQAQPQETPPAQQSQPAPAEPPAVEHPASASIPGPSEATGAAPLRVMVGKSLLINTSQRLKRVSITDPAVADVQVVTPTQILVHGRSAGEVSLLIWDELERSRSFDLRVDVDVTAAAEEEKSVFPDEQIIVTPSRSAIVLSGHVSDESVAQRAGKIAEAYSKNVVNVLTFGPKGAQEVLLEVKFAEVDRTVLTQLGVNVLSTGAGNTIGTVTTGQFGGFGPQRITDTFGPAVSGVPYSFTTQENINDVLNLFFFRPDIHLGALIRDLQQKNLLQILAEPNLIAVNGKEASFLAGGEFPFPVVQPGQGFTAVTIMFKEFGVKLKFKPVIMPSGNIHLNVTPEVSTLDFANALTLSGFTVPALSTRRADTEFELQDGQSFVIAGLMDNRVTNLVNKIPGLGDIPILGAFFKSKSLQKSNAELMVLCTVKKISPDIKAPAGPANPLPFLDNSKFDGKKPGAEK